MTILDILKTSAKFLGLGDEITVLDNVTTETENQALANNEIKTLFDLSQFSIQEFCSNYVPMIVSVSIITNANQFSLSGLTNYLRVVSVKKDGISVPYKIINRNIVVEEDGAYEVLYSSYPSIQSLFTNIDFIESVSPEVLVLGLCGYYSLSKGMFDDFKNYHEEYSARASEIKELKIFDTPSRRWE